MLLHYNGDGGGGALW